MKPASDAYTMKVAAADADQPGLGPPSLKHLYYYATGFDLFLIAFTFVLFLVSGAVQGCLNLVMARALSFGPADKPTDAGLQILLYLGGYLGGGMAFVFSVASLAALYTRHKMMAKWKVGYVQAILRQDIGWYDVNQSQNLAGRMGEAMLYIDKAFNVPTYMGFMFLGNMMSVVIIAFIYAPVLAAICLSFAVLLVGPASFVLARTLGTRTRILADAYSSAGGFAAEIISAVRTVAALGLERFAVEKYDETLSMAEKVAVRTTGKLALSLSTITAFVFYVCAAASLYSLSVVEPQLRQTSFPFEAHVPLSSNGGAETIVSFCIPSSCGSTSDSFLLAQAIGDNLGEAVRYNSRCSPGYAQFHASCGTGEGLENIFTFFPSGWLPGNFTRTAFDQADATWPCDGGISFEMILIVMNSIIFAFLQLPQVPTSFSALLKGMTFAHSCLQIIRRIPPIDSFSLEGEKPESVAGAIEVKDVTFAYPAAPGFNICVGFFLSVPSGSSCALVGPSGSGKSTIVSLLLRFYNPQSGVITLDGRDITGLNLKWLRSQLGLVGQEPVLFQGTVAENIRYGREEATKAEIEEAAEQANALEFINDLCDGFATQVGQGGSKLSGGQKQRVAISRAIIKKPSVLMLDEATSALDYKSEKEVQAALDKVLTELKATSIVIAHRLSTIRSCDKIAVINGGKVVEEGTYTQLLAIGEGGLFHTLAAKQEKQDADDRLRRPSQASATGEAGDETVCVDDKNDEAKVRWPAADDGSTPEDAGSINKEKSIAKAKKPNVGSRLMKMYVAKDKWRLPFGFIASTICGAASAFMGLVIVNSSFTFRDEFDPNRLRRTVMTWGIVSLCIGIFIHVVETTYKIQFAIAGEGLTRRLRVMTLQRLLCQEIGYFDEEDNSVGALSEFLAQKISLVQGAAQDELQQGLVSMSSFVTAIVISVLYGDWRLMLVFVFGYILGIAILVVGQTSTGSQEERYKQQGAAVDEESEEAKTGGALVGEVVAAIKTVCSFNAEHAFLSRYSETVAKERRKVGGARMWLGSLAMGLGMGFIMLVMGFALYLGMYLMETDIESFMDAVSDTCSLPTVNVGRLMVPMMSFIGAMLTMGSNATVAVDATAAKAAAEALFARVDRTSLRDPSSQQGEQLENLRGDIEVKDVFFAYPTRPKILVCRGYSLSVPAGTLCALVGPSGAGKSTLVNLLLRFYDPHSGTILLDGHDITGLNLAWLRNQLGLVGQEPVLFQGTVADNIRNGKEGATQAEIEEAATQANAHGFITDGTLSNSYQTQVGLRGGQLSGGQKQRVAIARALVRRPKIMLLDEATSALDGESEGIVQAALDAIMTRHKRTTIVVAHRLSTIRGADLIAVVNKGKIIESGSHDELRAKEGLYAELLAAQTAHT